MFSGSEILASSLSERGFIYHIFSIAYLLTAKVCFFWVGHELDGYSEYEVTNTKKPPLSVVYPRLTALRVAFSAFGDIQSIVSWSINQPAKHLIIPL